MRAFNRRFALKRVRTNESFLLIEFLLLRMLYSTIAGLLTNKVENRNHAFLLLFHLCRNVEFGVSGVGRSLSCSTQSNRRVRDRRRLSVVCGPCPGRANSRVRDRRRFLALSLFDPVENRTVDNGGAVLAGNNEFGGSTVYAMLCDDAYGKGEI